jgi:hypothetical protein
MQKIVGSFHSQKIVPSLQVICNIAKGTPDDVNRAVEAAKVELSPI